MRKVVKKWFWVWQFEQEERWLNHMAAQGLALVGVSLGRYEFEECLPGEYGIRLELLEQGPASPEGERYISFLEETGAQQVGSYMNWVYFRKKTADGPFDLHSDLKSRCDHLKRIERLLLPLAIMNIGLGLNSLIQYLAHGLVLNLIGLVNLALAGWILWGARKLNKQRKALEAEARIFE